jgi:hypothetical protein
MPNSHNQILCRFQCRSQKYGKHYSKSIENTVLPFLQRSRKTTSLVEYSSDWGNFGSAGSSKDADDEDGRTGIEQKWN